MTEIGDKLYMIAGLGNPGEEYEHTRHNAGFDTVDALADELGVRYWKNEGGALVGKASYHGHELLLVKPQSFMNTSGAGEQAHEATMGIPIISSSSTTSWTSTPAPSA